MSKIRELGERPAQEHVPGTRPTSIKEKRNLERHKEKIRMLKFGEVIDNRLQKSQAEFVRNTDIVAVTSGLSNQVNNIAQAAVVKANQADVLEEKLQLINQGLIDVVALVEQAAIFSKESVYKYRFESALLKELVALNSEDEEIQEEEPEDEEGAEPEEQEASTEPTE